MEQKLHNTTGASLDPNTSPTELAKRIGVGEGEQLRNSSRRESYLQKIAGLVSLRNLVLYVQGHGAHVKLNRDTPEINVTGQQHEQDATDISTDEYDLLVQEVLTMHECGHVLFSDWPSFERVMNRVEMNERHLFKHIWNAAEDGAIERQITSEFSVRDDFRVMYANLHAENSSRFSIEQESMDGSGDRFNRYPIAHAALTAILDLWQEEVYDQGSGSLQKLLDPSNDTHVFGSPDDRDAFVDFMPTIQTYVGGMLSEPKARKRNKKTYDFWLEFKDLLDNSQVSGKRPLSRDSGDSGNGMPDDASPGTGESSRDADELEGETIVIEVDVPDDSSDSDEDDGDGQGGSQIGDDDSDEYSGWGLGDDEDEEDDEETGASGGSDDDSDEDDADDEKGESDETDDGDGDDDDGEDDDGDSDNCDSEGDNNTDETEGGESSGNGGLEEAEERVQRRYNSEIQREAEDAGGDELIDSAKELLDILKQGHDSGSLPDPNMQLVVPKPADDFSTDRFRAAKNQSRSLARIWEQKLQQQQRSRVHKGQRFGTPDSRSMSQSGRSLRVFKRKTTPRKKDYECMIVLDRSSSMSGQLISQAEIAAGSLLMSLQSIGVNTSMLSVDSNQPVLEQPFDGKVEDYKTTIFTGSSGGSTPLSKVMYLARHRLNRYSSRTRFLIVVTDGRPDRSEEFAKQINECNFPVLGVEIGAHSYGNPGYDRITQTPENGRILSSLRNLVEEVMF